MNKHLYLSLAALALLVSQSFQLQAVDFSKPDWVLSEEKNNVSVYTRGIEGNQNARVIKAVTYVEQSPVSLLALVTDYSAAHRWRRQVKAMETIKIIDEHNWYIRTVSDLPWPLPDRTATLKCHVEKSSDAQTIAYRFNTAPEMRAEGEGEDETINGEYKFVAQQDGTTQVTFKMTLISPMKVPDWLVSSMMGASFIDQMVLLRDVVAEPKYANAGVAAFDL